MAAPACGELLIRVSYVSRVAASAEASWARHDRCRRNGIQRAGAWDRSMPIVAAAGRPSTSFVLAMLRALHVDRLLAGGKERQLSDDALLYPERRAIGILSVV
jgi:hypothetical protein